MTMSDSLIARPQVATLDMDAIEDAWLTLVTAADRHEFGGAVALVARHGQVALLRATGWAVREPADQRSPMGEDTIFDLASLTKVVATTPSILHLVAQRAFTLDTPARDLLPVFRDENVAPEITVRRLLSHSAGLIAWLPVFLDASGPEAYLRGIAREPLAYPTGTEVRYSDPSFITLGEIVREVSGLSVADYAATHVFGPLGMTDTGFRPGAGRRLRIAATELGNDFEAAKAPDQVPAAGPWRTDLIRGDVHDGNAWYGFTGVAGHAGLFGTAVDLYRYGQMWLNGGELDGVRILPAELVAEATAEHAHFDGERRGLGWRLAPSDGGAGDEDSAKGTGPRAFGHTGFTGTSLWMDPDTGVVLVLLTNRVHPTVTDTYLTTRASFTASVFGAAR
jgi:CubicO group peptidase (beta-lactamase class C family)